MEGCLNSYKNYFDYIHLMYLHFDPKKKRRYVHMTYQLKNLIHKLKLQLSNIYF